METRNSNKEKGFLDFVQDDNNLILSAMKSYLCFPVVHFHYQGQKRLKRINTDNLPHLDDNDDWWDYWFTIGRYTYQLCGDLEDKMRLFRNLKIYVYPANSTLTDEERIDEINKVTISFERQ